MNQKHNESTFDQRNTPFKLTEGSLEMSNFGKDILLMSDAVRYGEVVLELLQLEVSTAGESSDRSES